MFFELPKKVFLFPEINQVKKCYHSPARIIKCVSEYAFLISKNNNNTNKKHKNQEKRKINKRN